MREHGLSETEAAVRAGVASSTINRWKVADEDFADDLLLARADYHVMLATRVRNGVTRAGTPDWRAAAWLLQKQFPEIYGSTRRPLAALATSSGGHTGSALTPTPGPGNAPAEPTDSAAFRPLPEIANVQNRSEIPANSAASDNAAPTPNITSGDDESVGLEQQAVPEDALDRGCSTQPSPSEAMRDAQNSPEKAAVNPSRSLAELSDGVVSTVVNPRNCSEIPHSQSHG